MAPGTPTLRRQGTAEFLGALLRSESAHDVAQEADVDDGRVGTLTKTRVDGDDDAWANASEPGSPFTGARVGMRRRGSGQSARGLPVDPFPLSEVSRFERGDSLRGGDGFGEATTTTTDGRETVTEDVKRATRATVTMVKSVRKSARNAGKSGTRTTAGKKASGSAKSAAPNAGFKSAAFGKVNAQHGANDAGDHHGWTYIPKRADRRRAIARFTTAIIRAAGQQSFISREGVGYRRAFDRFLLETYGDTFAEGGYWYKNAEIEPFFRMILFIATEGKMNIANDDVKYLFTKKEERQAAEWVLDEDVLARLGLTAKDVALVYEGQPRKTSKGFVRGTPLKVPPSTHMPPEPAPSLEAVVRAKTTNSAAMPPPPPRARTPSIVQSAAMSETGDAASSMIGVPMEIQKLFEQIPKPNIHPGLSATKSRQMSRQYSSDLSRLMSEFNTDPAQGDEFVRQYLQRSASELDAIAAIQGSESKAKSRAAAAANKKPAVKKSTPTSTTTSASRASKRKR